MSTAEKPFSVRPSEPMNAALEYLATIPYYARQSRTQIVRGAVVYLAAQERYAAATKNTELADRTRTRYSADQA